MKYMVDIDGTICKEIFLPDGKKDYANHQPMQERIAKINKLYDEGHEIHYWTARGATSGIDYTLLTKQQLEKWGCKFHRVRVGDKPHYDIWVDDKAHNSEEFFKDDSKDT